MPSLVERLTHAITTATNDDLSEVGSEKRTRHVDRIEVMQEARDAIECWSIVEQLRANEGAEVILLCDNPDFNGQPNNAIAIVDDWTMWSERRFNGDTMLDALRAALTTQQNEAALKAQERRDSGR